MNRLTIFSLRLLRLPESTDRNMETQLKVSSTAIDSARPRNVSAKRLLGCQFRRGQPFLDRPEDIARLIEVADQIYGDSPAKVATQATMVGLLAVTGMRIGEVIGLNSKDVDIDQGVN